MYWTKSFIGDTNPQDIQTTRDGNYIIVGHKYGMGPGFVAKTNPNGDTLWTKTFEMLEYSEFKAIESIDGEFFLLVGVCSVGGLRNGLVVKINTNGDVIWTRKYEKRGEVPIFQAIQKCTDENFLVAGGSLIIKLTPEGDTLWSRPIGFGNILSIRASNNENYLVAGIIYNDVSHENEVFLLKINNAGKILSTRNYSNFTGLGPCKLYPAGDGNYLLLGQNYGDALLMKITPEGDSIWTRTYSTPESDDNFYDIISTMDGGFQIVGNRMSNTGFNQWHLKINKMGDTLWTSTTYGYDYDSYSRIISAGNGKFLVLGKTSTKWVITCMVEDQYTSKDSLFSYKIPTRGLDSLNYGYQPLRVPSGMTVSAGGTVSWTPHTDSFSLEKVKFIVADDQGRKDTLSLNIFVNIKNKPSHIRAKHQLQKDKVADFFTIASYLQRGKVQFNFPSSVEFLSIYDMSGRLIDRINPVSSAGRQTILWPATGTGFHSGQYIVQAVDGKKTEAKAFMLGR